MAKIDIEKLSLEVIAELNKYGKVTMQAVEDAVIETAKATRAELLATSPKRTGKYAKNWSCKRDPNLKGKYRYDMVVFEKAPEYRLTHLLEKPHQKRNGGRTSGIPHIAEAEKHAKEMLEERIRRTL